MTRLIVFRSTTPRTWTGAPLPPALTPQGCCLCDRRADIIGIYQPGAHPWLVNVQLVGYGLCGEHASGSAVVEQVEARLRLELSQPEGRVS